jgi:hypothetical protein
MDRYYRTIFLLCFSFDICLHKCLSYYSLNASNDHNFPMLRQRNRMKLLLIVYTGMSLGKVVIGVDLTPFLKAKLEMCQCSRVANCKLRLLDDCVWFVQSGGD